MQIKVDLTGLEVEAKQSKHFRRLLKEALIEAVEISAIRVMGKVKDAMPVDTGNARAHWGVFTPEHIVNAHKIYYQNLYTEPIWKVMRGGLTIVQGERMTPHNYINDLNDGHSQKAPPMFLDMIAEQEATALANDAGKLVEEIF